MSLTHASPSLGQTIRMPAETRDEHAARSPLGAIPPPPGTLVSGKAGVSAPEYEEWTYQVTTTLTPRALVEYYEDKLRANSWTFGDILVDESVALITGRTDSNRADSRHALLLAAQSPVASDRLVLTLRLTVLVDRAP
jgi:hypothetical protein